MTQSSNYTLSIHRITSSSSSATNFSYQQLNWTPIPALHPVLCFVPILLVLVTYLSDLLPYIVAARTTQHRKHSIGADPQHTPVCITSIIVWRHRAGVSCTRSIATVVRVTYCDIFIVAVGYHVAMADVHSHLPATCLYATILHIIVKLIASSVNIQRYCTKASKFTNFLYKESSTYSTAFSCLFHCNNFWISWQFFSLLISWHERPIQSLHFSIS